MKVIITYLKNQWQLQTGYVNLKVFHAHLILSLMYSWDILKFSTNIQFAIARIKFSIIFLYCKMRRELKASIWTLKVCEQMWWRIPLRHYDYRNLVSFTTCTFSNDIVLKFLIPILIILQNHVTLEKNRDFSGLGL